MEPVRVERARWEEAPEERAPDASAEPEPEIVFGSRFKSAIGFPARLSDDDRALWRRLAPDVERISIESSADGAPQRALYYDSGSARDKPLLVVLHSWSASYLQNIHIPYARFAVENDWVFVQPNFRGPNRRPEATLSELAVQDVLDAVDHAEKQANVDPSRIYLIGYSSGAMMALVLAGREPDRWAGVAAWVAVYDLADWYEDTRRKGSRYAREIEISCGGAPRPGTAAAEECLRRSPAGWLHRAAGRAPVFIAHGLHDHLASPDHAIRAFNALAAPEDRLSDAEREHIVRRRALPDGLDGARIGELDDDPYFGPIDVPLVLRRSSGAATLALYDGAHDMFYEPGLRWLSEQRRG